MLSSHEVTSMSSVLLSLSLSMFALCHVSVTKMRSTTLSFINVDISQRLQAISLPFTLLLNIVN